MADNYLFSVIFSAPTGSNFATRQLLLQHLHVQLLVQVICSRLPAHVSQLGTDWLSKYGCIATAHDAVYLESDRNIGARQDAAVLTKQLPDNNWQYTKAIEKSHVMPWDDNKIRPAETSRECLLNRNCS